MVQQLFYDKKLEGYFFVCSKDDLNVFCSYCNLIIPLEDKFFVHNSYGIKELLKENLCRKCMFKKNFHLKIVDEFKCVEVVDVIPPGAELVIDFPPSLRVATTCFDAVFSNKGISADTSQTEIVDKTKMYGKHNHTFFISKDEDRKRLPISEFQDNDRVKEMEEETKRLELPVGDVNGFFNDILISKPLIDTKSIKRIKEET